MRGMFYAFLGLPVQGRFTIILAIVLIAYCIFGRWLWDLLSLVLHLLKVLNYGIYKIIEYPISKLHKLLGGIFGEIDQGLAKGFGKVDSALNKCYGILHKPKDIYRAKALLVFGVCAVYLIIPRLIGLHFGIFTFWENSYMKNEDKLVAFIESTSWLDEPVETVLTDNDEIINDSLAFIDEESTENNDYILPFSSTRLLTEEDLIGLSKEELRLARNEIYARNGRQFKDKDIQAYFESKEWYQNIEKLSLGTEPNLSRLEETNAIFIRDHE